ncbi:DUF819 family protein [Myxococcota bacterium]|nr:DUF819 family protein [Myxococcota bacterium]MBU1381117.1 DUF819 family protein [Myxococcota bacterium]MBU1496236.1 DUF819 family protein [Myxococcota bacterium]
MSEPTHVLAVLLGICASVYWLETRFKWRAFNWFPPYIWIYLIPVILTSLKILPSKSPVYKAAGSHGLPMVLVLLLLGLSLKKPDKSFFRSIAIMLTGTIGVIVGGITVFYIFRGFLPADSWKTVAILSGSWIGGTANMAVVAQGLNGETALSPAVIADNIIFIFWLPVLLYSIKFRKFFNDDQVDRTTSEPVTEDTNLNFRDILSSLAVAATVASGSLLIASFLPTYEPVFNTTTWHYICITTVSIVLSFTTVSRMRGMNALAMALLYFFISTMGARSDISGITGVFPVFLLAAFLWIIIHGLFIIAGTFLWRGSITDAALGSAANIGGVASAVLVASHHNPKKIPHGVFLAVIGFSVGNYAAFFTAHICWLLAN